MQHELPVKVICLKNNSLGLIKWEQMVFLGNPEYGVDFAPVDFVKIAEGCGAKAVHIEDPARCGEQLREALSYPGPAVVEAVVDQNEPPLPPKITQDQAKKMYDALRRGEKSRRRIGLTIGRQIIDEIDAPASPYGVWARAKEKVGGRGSD
jgi:pyruvate dehydrogenase (quinone)/pyruvate oxidase